MRRSRFHDILCVMLGALCVAVAGSPDAAHGQSVPSSSFVTTWRTTASNQSITIPASGTYTIDWGDGTVEEGVSGRQPHRYDSAGTYTVRISDAITRFHLAGRGVAPKLVSIDQWGTAQWTSMWEAFWGASRRLTRRLSATGGTVQRVRRVDKRRDLFQIHLQPSGHGAVTVILPSSTSCDIQHALCTPDGRALSSPVSVTVQGPPGLSVADAEVEEASYAELAFVVTLNRAVSDTVTVAWTTTDVTAKAGADYTAASGTLTFAAGETEKTVSVAVLDDTHDEESETLRLTLSTPSGAYLADATATGTINNSDPLQRAWLSRFGRTVGTHVADAVGERLWSTPGKGSHLQVGGYRLPLGRRAAGLTLNLEGRRQAPTGRQPVNQDLRLQATWTF